MADLNNTIQTIEHCVNGGYCNMCKLRDERRCDAMTSCKTLLTDALELLKEQQPKEPMQLKYSETREEYWFYESICPKCGNHWISNGTDHFCPACGQPVFEPCEEEQKDGEPE